VISGSLAPLRIALRDLAQDRGVWRRRIRVQRDHLATRVPLENRDHDLGSDLHPTADQPVFRETVGRPEIQVHVRAVAPLVEDGSHLFAKLIKFLTATSPLVGRRLQVAIASTQRTFTSTPSIIFSLLAPPSLAIRLRPPASLPRLKALLAPYPSGAMICWPVSTRAGNVKNNDPSLIEPIAAE
jgi:hypothetical protein